MPRFDEEEDSLGTIYYVGILNKTMRNLFCLCVQHPEKEAWHFPCFTFSSFSPLLALYVQQVKNRWGRTQLAGRDKKKGLMTGSCIGPIYQETVRVKRQQLSH